MKNFIENLLTFYADFFKRNLYRFQEAVLAIKKSNKVF